MESSSPRSNGKHSAAHAGQKTAGNGKERSTSASASREENHGGSPGEDPRRSSLQPLPYRLPISGREGSADGSNGGGRDHDGHDDADSLGAGAQGPESTAEILAAELRREIAARRDLEMRLALSEQRLAYMMTSSPMGFFDCDGSAGNAYYSPSYKEMLGYRADELPDRYQTFLDLLHPEDQAQRLAGRARSPSATG